MLKALALGALAVTAVAGPAPAQESRETLHAAVRAVEARQADVWLASVEAQLQLTAAQQETFAAYAAAIRAQAELKAEHRTNVLFVDTAQLPPAPEALGRDVQWLRERTDALAAVQAAAGELYKQLTPQQRTAFDFLAVSASGTGSDEPY